MEPTFWHYVIGGAVLAIVVIVLVLFCKKKCNLEIRNDVLEAVIVDNDVKTNEQHRNQRSGPAKTTTSTSVQQPVRQSNNPSVTSTQENDKKNNHNKDINKSQKEIHRQKEADTKPRPQTASVSPMLFRPMNHEIDSAVLYILSTNC